MFLQNHRLGVPLAASALSASMLFAGTVPASAVTPGEMGMSGRTGMSTDKHLSGTVIKLPWDFCLTYNGAPKEDKTVYAPSPDEAVISVSQVVAVANSGAVATGYPPLWGWHHGRCQFH